MGVECPNIDNVVREILDMMEATPQEIRDGITLPGLISSGHGHIVRLIPLIESLCRLIYLFLDIGYVVRC